MIHLMYGKKAACGFPIRGYGYSLHRKLRTAKTLKNSMMKNEDRSTSKSIGTYPSTCCTQTTQSCEEVFSLASLIVALC